MASVTRDEPSSLGSPPCASRCSRPGRPLGLRLTPPRVSSQCGNGDHDRRDVRGDSHNGRAEYPDALGCAEWAAVVGPSVHTPSSENQARRASPPRAALMLPRAAAAGQVRCIRAVRRRKNGKMVSIHFLTPSPSVAIIRAMGRLPRTIEDGLVYHALNRGNNRADVFGDDDRPRRLPRGPRQDQGTLSVSSLRLLSHDQSLPSPAPAGGRAIDQPDPPIPHGRPHLALSQAASDLGSCLAGPVQEPRGSG